MTPFLKQTADYYYLNETIEDKCFIFPNRRSMTFFDKYLRENIGNPQMLAYGCSKRRPMRMPLTLTINDFFYRAHGADTEDRVTLLLELYECYKKINKSAEPLDEFISWGDIILGDFSDVDKYMVDPKQIFTNVAEYKEIQDDWSHLKPEQRKAIEDFISHFRDGHGLKENATGDNVKARFLKIWDMLLPLYEEFNSHLKSKNMAYDGLVCRGLVEKVEGTAVTDFFRNAFPKYGKFVFVGLNALNESELRVLRRMNKAGIAEFCWDYSSEMLRNERNRSSAYMSRNVSEFKQKWRLDPEGLGEAEINVVSVPSSVGQAKQLKWILEKSAVVKPGSKASLGCDDCAVVLPDESLLMTVLNSIPGQGDGENIDINVTMGYPMSSSAVWTLMEDISAMQLHLRKQDDGWYFYHRQVRSLLSNKLISQGLSEEGKELSAKILAASKYYVPQSDFQGDSLLELLFRPVVEDPKKADSGQIRRFQDYQMEFISCLAPKLQDNPAFPAEPEFAKRYYSCINLLRGKTLDILPLTYVRLLSQLARGESVPFEGEPLKGLQVMGPLETRALDFKTVIILSCNEGIFPKKNVSVSFIPPELRRGFGLPTNEFKDAVLAYSFYRLIQRAEKVWLVYDSRMQKMNAGEESRYIKQLEYHFRKPLKRYIAKAKMLSREVKDSDIAKTEEMVEQIKKTRLSVTALQNYLQCPVRFYYSKVCKLKSENEISESMDKSMVGNVYHDTMHALYLGPAAMDPDFPMDRDSVAAAKSSGRIVPMRSVSDAYLGEWFRKKEAIRARIRSLVKTQLHKFEVSGKDLVLEEIILQYVLKTIERDREHLKYKGVSSFDVIGLEMEVNWKCGDFDFYGYLDRVDSFGDGTVRIVDYKSGRVDEKELKVTDKTADTTVEELFKEDAANRPKIALQLFLYGKYVENKEWLRGKTMLNVIYQPALLFTTPVSELETARSEVFSNLCMEKLKDTLAELVDVNKPFRRTKVLKSCSYCDFKNICGR